MAEGEDVLAKMGQDLIKESYGDLVKPIAKDFGEALAGIFKAITYYPRYWAMTSEISLEEKVTRFKERLAKNIEIIPLEARVLPPPSILGPSIQALEYAIADDEISDMFSNLIASSMDSSGPEISHPAFVEIIKQISPEEAKIIKFLAIKGQSEAVKVRNSDDSRDLLSIVSFLCRNSGCKNSDNEIFYLENLQRLNLVHVFQNPESPRFISSDLEYTHLIPYANFLVNRNHPDENIMSTKVYRLLISFTEFGKRFVSACIK
jgi:Abortive infection alpha